MTESPIPARYARNPQILSSDIDDETVMLSIESGYFFSAKGIGPFIWNMMEAPRSRSELLEGICEAYDVDADTAGSDLDRFLEELDEHGMLVRS
ncbi:MAG: PqqD family protein [Novosphingobium sp.]|nr:PqqD family protein [Novosphingobium sp.]